MTISNLPPSPSRADDPAGFSSKADALLGALPQFVTETNATASAVDQVKVDVELLKTQTDSIRADAITQTTALRDTTLGYRNDAQTAAGQAAGYRTEAQTYRDGAQAAAVAAGSAAGLPSLVGNAGKALIVAPGEDAVEWGIGVASGYQEFTSSGTWTKPADATWVYVECINGGAGGHGGSAAIALNSYALNIPQAVAAGAAGAAGHCVLLRAQDLPASCDVVVGSGGTGGAGGDALYELDAAGAIVRHKFSGLPLNGTPGGISSFLSASFLNASQFPRTYGNSASIPKYPTAGGGVAAVQCTNMNSVTTGNASNGNAGPVDDASKTPAAGGVFARAEPPVLGTTMNIIAGHGADGLDFCGGGGGGGACGGGLGGTVSNTYLYVTGGNGGKGGIGSGGGNGGNAGAAIYTNAGTKTSLIIECYGGRGGDGENGIVRIWWW